MSMSIFARIYVSNFLIIVNAQGSLFLLVGSTNQRATIIFLAGLTEDNSATVLLLKISLVLQAPEPDG